MTEASLDYSHLLRLILNSNFLRGETSSFRELEACNAMNTIWPALNEIFEPESANKVTVVQARPSTAWLLKFVRQILSLAIDEELKLQLLSLLLLDQDGFN